MLQLIGIVESFILLMLSIIHFYWACGGKWGINNALPSNSNGEKIITPGKGATILVGIILLSFVLYFFIKTNTSISLNPILYTYGGWIISSLFFLRAIGDFKYIGFFKKIKSTSFGKSDTFYFSPLCLFIAIIGLLIELNL